MKGKISIRSVVLYIVNGIFEDIFCIFAVFFTAELEMKTYNLVALSKAYVLENQIYTSVIWQLLQVSFFPNAKSVLLLPCCLA